MKVRVNGADTELEAGTTLAELVERFAAGGRSRSVAVAVDGEVVRREERADHVLNHGARIEIVSAVPGG